MIYRIKMMGGSSIPLGNEDDLKRFLAEVNNGRSRLILTKYGVVNPASIDSILPYKEMNEEVGKKTREMKSVNGELVYVKKEEAENEVLGVSPFAKILSEKMRVPQKFIDDAKDQSEFNPQLPKGNN